jgi:hypothetical protein
VLNGTPRPVAGPGEEPRLPGEDPLLSEVMQLLAEVQKRLPRLDLTDQKREARASAAVPPKGPEEVRLSRFYQAVDPMLDALHRLKRRTEQEIDVICEFLERSSHEDFRRRQTRPPGLG